MTAAALSRRVEIGGVEVDVTRKRVKHLRLVVQAPDGRVRVTAPMRAPESAIHEMVLGRIDWITHHQTRLRAMPRIPIQEFTEADRARLKALIATSLDKWQPIIGVRASRWTVRRMRSRWGSCNTRSGRIALSLELAAKPVEHVEYVVVHELVHLLEASHNARFYALMSRFLPDWKRLRSMLNGRVD